MAKPRRRAAGRRFEKRDWVYTNDGYTASSFNQTSGVAGAFAQPLCYSQGAKRVGVQGDLYGAPGATDYRGGYSFPADRRQKVYAFDGLLMVEPTTWAIGNVLMPGARLIIGDMGPEDNSLLEEADYSMWTNGTLVPIQEWANDRRKLAEWRGYRGFGDNGAPMMMRMRWSSRTGRVLEERQAVFLWLEAASAGVNMRMRLFSRLLMRSA